MTIASPDRCPWCGSDPIYVAYHDTEWGVPERDGRALWEKLVLDSFQAGLAWITILKKREAFRVAFDRFDPERVASFADSDVERLLADSGIVRSRAKILATIGNAQAYLAMRDAGEDFADFAWNFVDGAPLQNAWRRQADVPAETPLAQDMAKALRARGFRFTGPVIVYAWMQAAGLVSDHLVSCFRYAEQEPS